METLKNRLNESLNESVDVLSIDVLSIDVNTAKKSLTDEGLTIDKVRELNKERSAIEMKDKMDKGSVKKVKDAMKKSGIKYDFSLPF